MEHKFYGKYRGFVIQNDDPDKEGKVKVWVPDVSATVYNDWNKLLGDGIDHKFVFLGENTNPDITAIVDQLKKILPWSPVVQPIVGSGTSGTYNSPRKIAKVGDGNHENNGDNFDEYESDGGDNKTSQPSAAFYKNPVSDAFVKAGEQSNDQLLNPFGTFVPHSYSNKAKGSFSIPGVGAHVWVFFEQGDPLYPVVDGIIFAGDDFKNIHEQTSIDYPGAYENASSASGAEDDVYRGKWVVNHKGGAIEIISTTQRERLRLGHFSGSFLDMTNEVTSRLATNNDQLLVMGDQFNTINRNQATHIKGAHEQTVLGDSSERIGDVAKWKPVFDQIKDAIRPVHDVKMLFDIQRADFVDGATQSPQQTKSGSEAPCPVCSQGLQAYQIGEEKPPKTRFTNGVANGDCTITPAIIEGGENNIIPKTGEKGKMYSADCWCCGGSGKSPSSQDGNWQPDSNKQNLGELIVNTAKAVQEFEAQLGTAATPSAGNKTQIVAKNKVTVVGLTFNDFPSVRKDPKGKLVPYAYRVDRQGVYKQYVSSPLVEPVHVDSLPGGDWDVLVGQRYSLTVGSGGMRLKTTGPTDISGTIVSVAGESVAVYSNTELKLEGKERVDIEGKTITLRPRVHRGPEEEHDDTIGDGKGKFDDKAVLVDGNLSVANNAIIRGGAYIGGELMFHHLTAPLEYHLTETEPNVTYGDILPGHIIGQVVSVSGVLMVSSVCAPNALHVHPHTHWNRGPAMTLMAGHEDVMETASRVNGDTVVLPHSILDCSVSSGQTGGIGVMPKKSGGNKPDPLEGPFGRDEFMDPDTPPSGIGEGTLETAEKIKTDPLRQ